MSTSARNSVRAWRALPDLIPYGRSMLRPYLFAPARFSKFCALLTATTLAEIVSPWIIKPVKVVRKGP